MQQRRRGTPRETPFEYTRELTIGRRSIYPGDPIKVRYQRGTWTFSAVVTNTDTGAQWVDVYTPETMHGPGTKRAVRLEHVSPVPKRRRKKL